MRDQRLEKLAILLVNYSTGVKKGDKVSIKAEDIALPFIISVAREAIKIGAFVDYSVTIPEVEELILKFGNEEQLLIGYVYADMTGGVDSRKSTFEYFITFAGGCLMAITITKVHCFE